jgi:DNA-binding response OmpR family regulator
MREAQEMSKVPHVLIVDDEDSIRYFLSEELKRVGYAVQTAASGEEALARLQTQTVDLILLDLKMGGMDGLKVMEKLAELPLSPAVIILTAHASLDSAVEAMRLGGCDYLRKPCSTEKLLESVEKSLSKRRDTLQQQEMIRMIAETASQLQAGIPPVSAPPKQVRFLEGRGLLLDLEQEVVTRDGEELVLTQSEFRLLACLMEYAGRTVSYENLYTAVHGHQDTRNWDVRQALSTHLWRLRRKLGECADGSPCIVNVRGRGYKFIGGD